MSYPQLTEADELVIRQFLAKIQIIGLNQEIKDRTISLRKNSRLKTPDALIAATALIHDTCILTNDTQFRRIDELRCNLNSRAVYSVFSGTNPNAAIIPR